MKSILVIFLFFIVQSIPLPAIRLASTRTNAGHNLIEIAKVRPAPIRRINAARVIAMKNNKVPIDKIPPYYDWRPLRSIPLIKPILLDSARDSTKDNQEAVAFLEKIEQLLSEYGRNQDVVLRNSAILKTMTTDSKFKFGYDTEKFDLYYDIKRAEQRMNEIMELNVMKESLLTHKESLEADNQLDAMRLALENHPVETIGENVDQSPKIAASEESDKPFDPTRSIKLSDIDSSDDEFDKINESDFL